MSKRHQRLVLINPVLSGPYSSLVSCPTRETPAFLWDPISQSCLLGVHLKHFPIFNPKLMVVFW